MIILIICYRIWTTKNVTLSKGKQMLDSHECFKYPSNSQVRWDQLIFLEKVLDRFPISDEQKAVSSVSRHFSVTAKFKEIKKH